MIRSNKVPKEFRLPKRPERPFEKAAHKISELTDQRTPDRDAKVALGGAALRYAFHLRGGPLRPGHVLPDVVDILQTLPKDFDFDSLPGIGLQLMQGLLRKPKPWAVDLRSSTAIGEAVRKEVGRYTTYWVKTVQETLTEGSIPPWARWPVSAPADAVTISEAGQFTIERAALRQLDHLCRGKSPWGELKDALQLCRDVLDSPDLPVGDEVAVVPVLRLMATANQEDGRRHPTLEALAQETLQVYEQRPKDHAQNLADFRAAFARAQQLLKEEPPPTPPPPPRWLRGGITDHI